MSVRSVVTIDESAWKSSSHVLRVKSAEVAKERLGSNELCIFARDMFETLYATSQGVGLAAPQIGILERIVAIDIKRDGKKPLFLVNPEWHELGADLVEGMESCLSVPNHVGKVKRYGRIHLEYFDLVGNKVQRDCDGFLARVIQHEIDHLNGVLYIDRAVEGSVAPSEGFEVKLAERSIAHLVEKQVQS